MEKNVEVLQDQLLEISKLCWGDIPLDRNSPLFSGAYDNVLRLREYKDELFEMVSRFQLAKLESVWTDKRFKSIHSTRSRWKLRPNQPDIFMFAVSDRNREYAIVFEHEGKWVSGEQHYPVPFVNSQKTHRHVGDALTAALETAGWKP